MTSGADDLSSDEDRAPVERRVRRDAVGRRLDVSHDPREQQETPKSRPGHGHARLAASTMAVRTSRVVASLRLRTRLTDARSLLWTSLNLAS